MLVGREPEIARVCDLLDGATPGRGVALVGEPGSGKSTLLDAVGERRGRTVEVTGDPRTVRDLWGGVRSVLVGLRAELAELPRRERTLLSDLRDGAGAAPHADAVCAAMASLVGFADADPVTLVLDDAAWVDGLSRRAFAVAAAVGGLSGFRLLAGARSRLEAEMLFPGCEVVELLGLNATQVDDLASGVVPEERLEAVVAYTGGNAAGVLDLLATGSASVGGSLGPGDGEDPRPGARTQASLHRQLEGVPDGCGLALALEALRATDAQQRESIWEWSGIPPQALEPAAAAGLVVGPRGEETFPHALFRDAVLAVMHPRTLRRAHDLLASSGPATRGGSVPSRVADDGGARRLADEAGRLHELGDPAGAARLYERAATLAGDDRVRAGFLASAGLAAVEAGLPEGEPLLWSVVRAGMDETLTAGALLALGGAAASRGQYADAAEVAARAEATPAAGPAHLMAAALSWSAGEQEAFLRHAAWSTATISAPVPDMVRAHALLVSLARDRMVGSVGPTWSDDLAAAVALAQQDPDPTLATPVAMILLYLGQLAEANTMLRAALARARASAALPSVCWVDASMALLAVRRGDPAGAVARALESIALAPTAGPLAETVGHMAAATAQSVLGDVASTEFHARSVLGSSWSMPSALAVAHAALGRAHAADRPAEAADEFLIATRLLEGRDLLVAPHAAVLGDAVMALARAGRHAEAARVHDRVASVADATGLPRMVYEERLARLCLGTDAEIDEAATSGLAQADAEDRVARAVLHLVYGQRLRRARRPVDARQELRRSVELGHDLGLRELTRAASRELEAAGGEVDRSRPEPRLADLTPQEHAVCKRAASGATTKEIAASMFLSPKTVETHLGHAYRKLGVQNRAQLAGLMPERLHVDPSLDAQG